MSKPNKIEAPVVAHYRSLQVGDVILNVEEKQSRVNGIPYREFTVRRTVSPSDLALMQAHQAGLKDEQIKLAAAALLQMEGKP